MTQHLYDKIRETLETTPGLTQKGLAERMGLNPAAVNRMLYGRRNIMADEIPIIEDYLGIPLELSPVTAAGSGPHYSPQRGIAEQQQRVPVYACTAEGLGRGVTLSQSEVVDWVARHPAQVGINNAFAVYIFSEAMEPRYFQGELIYLHPGRPLERDRDYLIEMNNGAVGVRRVLQQSEKKIRVAQFNPPQEKDLLRENIQAVYCVVGRG